MTPLAIAAGSRFGRPGGNGSGGSPLVVMAILLTAAAALGLVV